MPRKIQSWEELVGLESEEYKLEINVEGRYGNILLKSDMDQARGHDFRFYLSTHTFYPSHCKTMTETLQGFGFDVELVADE